MSSFRALLLLTALLPAAVNAGQMDGATAQADDVHPDRGQDIIVTGIIPRDKLDLLSGVSVLSGTALERSVRPTLGDTLSQLPGVSATSFGPNASRPILRGFQGERIRVLTDGIGSFDVSNTSADHAVVINPLTARRIEVVRGPAALLYGSAAIGGVVNVADGRIPSAIPDDHIHLDATAGYATAARARNIGASADVALGGSGFVAHVDGSWAKSGDLRTGGYIYAEPVRAEAEALGQSEEGDRRGRLPNSAAETKDGSVGLAYISGKDSIGVAVSHYANTYGVPSRFDPASEEPAEAPVIDMKQTRVDARADVGTGGGFIDRLRFRFGFADYQHAELEADGEVGTRFFAKGLEARFEAVQRAQGVWKGASGVQYLVRDMDIVGEEAFLPRNSTEQAGIFTLQQFDFGAVQAEAGMRLENSRVRALGNDARRFTAVSGSGGASIALAEGWRAGLNLSYSERAPSAEELYADGPHGATQAYEIGNPDFGLERSKSAELTLRGRGDGYRMEVSAFYSHFDGFIYDVQTGDYQDDLPVFQAYQSRARYYGAEMDGDIGLADLGAAQLKATLVADYVRADLLDGGGPVPRIPPFRVIAGLAAEGGPLGGRIEVERAAPQSRTAEQESRTPGWTMVNASLDWRPMGADGPLTLMLAANNIFDVEARPSTSVLKDYAPLAGRDIRLSARVSF